MAGKQDPMQVHRDGNSRISVLTVSESKPVVRTRDAEATRQRILNAAKREFAHFGLGGARVDEIAKRAKANKRMIYHYFGGKEELFTAVLEDAYLDIRAAERKLNLDAMPPMEAMEALVSFTWNYYLKNPEVIILVNSENLHKARHLKKSDVIKSEYPGFVSLAQKIIDRGVTDGVFRPGLDPMQLNITIAAINYFYLTNRYTGSIVYGRDLMDPDLLKARIAFNIDTIRRLLRA